MEIIIGSIGFGIIVPLMAWIAKTLMSINERLAADTEKWDKNTEDHERAFGEIKVLEDGQTEIKSELAEIKGKVDILVGRDAQ